MLFKKSTMVDHNFETVITHYTPIFKQVISGRYKKKNCKQGPQTHLIWHKIFERTHTGSTNIKGTTTFKQTTPTPTKHAHNPNPLTKMFTKIGKRSGTLQ